MQFRPFLRFSVSSGAGSTNFHCTAFLYQTLQYSLSLPFLHTQYPYGVRDRNTRILTQRIKNTLFLGWNHCNGGSRSSIRF